MDFSSEASEEEEWETVVDLNNQNASEEKSIHDDDEQVADKEICIDLNPLEEVTSKKQTSLKAHRSVHLTHIISMVLGYSIMNSTANTKKLQSEILKIVPSNILEAVNRKRNKITEPEKEFKNLIRSILIWFKNEIRVEKVRSKFNCI